MTPTDHAAIVREALHEALTLLHGLDYEEESRIDRAVTAIENLAPALDALEAQAEDMVNWQEAARRRQERAEAAEAERDRLQEALTATEGSYDLEVRACADAEHERDQLTARAEELKATLRKYGDHKTTCALRRQGGLGQWAGMECDCGFDAVLDKDTA